MDVSTKKPETELSGYNAIKNKFFPDLQNKKVTMDPDTISITTDRSPEIKDIVDTLMPEIIRQSDEVPKDPMANFDITKEPDDDGGLFGDFFSMLFKDEEKKPQKDHLKNNINPTQDPFNGAKIPPFKTISADFSTIELTTEKPTDYEDPLIMDVGALDGDNNRRQGQVNENGTAIKNILLNLLGHGDTPYTTSTPPARATPKQPLKFPVHSVPYIASSVHINPRPLEPIRNNLDEQQHTSKVSLTGQSYGQILDDLNLSAKPSTPLVVHPLNLETMKRHQSEHPAKIFSKPVTTNANDMGLLKLAGCNIYGRMYRVGRIISELSGPCLQCMCKEAVGVHCTPLAC